MSERDPSYFPGKWFPGPLDRWILVLNRVFKKEGIRCIAERSPEGSLRLTSTNPQGMMGDLKNLMNKLQEEVKTVDPATAAGRERIEEIGAMIELHESIELAAQIRGGVKFSFD